MSSENSSPIFLDTSVQYLKGIGPKKAKVLEKNGFESLKDLFFLFPRRYEDRTRFKSIKELQEGEVATVRGRVVQSQVRYFKGRGHCQIVLKDASGTARSTWFNQSYLARSFRKDDEIILYGKVSRFGTLQFHNPEYEKVESGDDPLIHSGRITPIYPLASGLFQRSLRHSLWFLIENHKQEIGEHLPDSLLKKHQFLDLQTALEMIHFPRDRDSYLKAKHRLIFDDFFMFE